MFEHHRVDAVRQRAVIAGEIFRNAMRDVFALLQADHGLHFAIEALQLVLHLLHAVHQLTGFIARFHADVVVEAARSDCLCSARGGA